MSQSSSPCHGCHAGCCRAFAVPITGADVLRLERETGQTFWDFACRWEDRDGIIAGNFAPHLHFADEPRTPFTLCLLHQPSDLYPGTTKCRFLEEPSAPEGLKSAGSRCGVYHHRPSACRVFPLRSDSNSPLVVLNEVPANGRPNEGHEAYNLCGRSWEPSDIDPIQGPQDVAVAEFESAFFKQVAALWNERPGDWLKFPEFLRLVYERRVVRSEPATPVLPIDEPVTLPFPVGGRRAA